MNSQKTIEALTVALTSVLRDAYLEEPDKLAAIEILMGLRSREQIYAEIDARGKESDNG